MTTSSKTNKEELEKIKKEFEKEMDRINVFVYTADRSSDKSEHLERKHIWTFIEKHLTQAYQKGRKDERERTRIKLEVAIEAWMETYDKMNKQFQTDDFIKFLENEIR